MSKLIKFGAIEEKTIGDSASAVEGKDFQLNRKMANWLFSFWNDKIKLVARKKEGYDFIAVFGDSVSFCWEDPYKGTIVRSVSFKSDPSTFKAACNECFRISRLLCKQE